MVFKHKDPIHIRRFKKIAEAMAVGTGIIMFWRGIWLLGDTYLYPDPVSYTHLDVYKRQTRARPHANAVASLVWMSSTSPLVRRTRVWRRRDW